MLPEVSLTAIHLAGVHSGLLGAGPVTDVSGADSGDLWSWVRSSLLVSTFLARPAAGGPGCSVLLCRPFCVPLFCDIVAAT